MVCGFPYEQVDDETCGDLFSINEDFPVKGFTRAGGNGLNGSIDTARKLGGDVFNDRCRAGFETFPAESRKIDGRADGKGKLDDGRRECRHEMRCIAGPSEGAALAVADCPHESVPRIVADRAADNLTVTPG